MENNWRIRIIDVGYKLERDIFIFRKRFDGKAEMLDGSISNIGGALPIKPTLSLTPEALQEFADTLNGIGIKPQQGFVEGKLEATENHLKDLQKLVFKNK